MRTRTHILGAALLLGLAAWAAEGWAVSATPPPQRTRIVSTKKIDGNNWETYLDNTGMHTVPYRGSTGGYWPKGSGHGYIFGAGIWVGALFSNRSDTNVAWGYNPNSGASNMGPTTPDFDETKSQDAAARVYLSNNPTDRQQWPEKDSTGRVKVRSVLDSWAAFSDVNPVYTKVPDKPFGVGVKRISYQWPYPGYSDIIFFLFYVTNLTNQRPVPGGARTFTDCIIGNCMDNDIGNESGTAANDVFTLNLTYYHFTNPKTGQPDSVIRNLAMQYQTQQESGWGAPPYWMGARFFESPRATKPVTITSLNHPEANRTVMPGEQLGMTACKLFTLSTDPSKAAQRYLELAGYYYLNPVYEPYDLDFPGPGDHRFLQNSGPFDLAPDSTVKMTIAIIGGKDSSAVVGTSDKAQDIYNQNFLAPFPPEAPNLTVIPGNKKVTLVWDNWPEWHADPFYDLITDTTQKRKYRPYDFQGYKVFKARNLADLGDPTKREQLLWIDLKDGNTIVMDAQVTIKDLPNPDPRTPWKTKDTVHVYDTLGYDTGIKYTYTDSGQAPDSIGVANGFPYFYGVIGFDYQYYDSVVSGFTYRLPGNPTTLTGEPTEKYAIAVPRGDPENIAKANVGSLTLVGPSYTSGTTISKPVVVASGLVKNHTYAYIWNPVYRDTIVYPASLKPQYTYTIRDSTLHQDLRMVKASVDTFPVPQHWVNANDFVPIFDGISFDATYDMRITGFRLARALDAGKITPAPSYTDTVLADTMYSFPFPSKFVPDTWMMRGSLFQIRWHRTGGSTGDSLLSVTVRDSSDRVDIPFEGGMNIFGLKKPSWSFGVDADSVGYQYIDSVSCSGPQTALRDKFKARWLFVCGFRYLFNYITIAGQKRPGKMVWARRPQDGEVWTIQAKGPNPPVEGNMMVFTPTPEASSAATQDQLDRVMVVPNPYLVRNNWDNSQLQKHLMFTHLPDVCTIRIFTLAGDMIKVIYHNTTNNFQPLGGKVPNTATTGESFGTGGTEFWDLLTYNTQKIASGVYLFRVDAGDKHKIGKFAVIQ